THAKWAKTRLGNPRGEGYIHRPAFLAARSSFIERGAEEAKRTNHPRMAPSAAPGTAPTEGYMRTFAIIAALAICLTVGASTAMADGFSFSFNSGYPRYHGHGHHHHHHHHGHYHHYAPPVYYPAPYGAYVERYYYTPPPPPVIYYPRPRTSIFLG